MNYESKVGDCLAKQFADVQRRFVLPADNNRPGQWEVSWLTGWFKAQDEAEAVALAARFEGGEAYFRPYDG